LILAGAWRCDPNAEDDPNAEEADLTVMGTSFANTLFLLSPATLSEELINTQGDI